MAELYLPDIAGQFQRGQALGTARRKDQEAEQRRNRLASIAEQAYSAAPDQRAALVQQAVGVDPDAGFALNTQLQGGDEAREKALLNTARMFDAAPDALKPQVLQQIAPRLEQYLPGISQAPIEQVSQGVKAFIASRSGAARGSKVIGRRLLDDAGNVLYEAPQDPRYFQTDQGLVAVGPEGAREVRLPDAGGTPSPSALNPGQDFAAIGQEFGLQPTSVQRTPERNAEVGGVPNSFHLTGQASDWAVPPEKKPAFIAAARARGYQAVDEGDHIHLEPPGSPARGGVDQPQPQGRRLLPAASIAQQQQMELARQAAARAEAANRRAEEAARRAAMGTPPQGMRWNAEGTSLERIPGAPEPAAARPTEGERKAATLLKRLEFSEQQLEKAVTDAPSAESPNIGAEVVRGLPLVGGVAANTLTPAARQRVEAAQLDILDAALTLGTGAAYTREQLEGYRRSYFPQVGDDDTTIADKQARLKNVIDAAKIAAGRAAPAGGGTGGGGAREITSQAEYDALPSGAIYLEDGQQYRKP